MSSRVEWGVAGRPVAVIKFQRVACSCVQSPADDLVHFSSFAGLVVTLQVLCFLNGVLAVSDKPGRSV